MWFELTKDERLHGRCATERCPGGPTWRLESGGIGANYCSGCHAKIVAGQAQCLPATATKIPTLTFEEARFRSQYLQDWDSVKQREREEEALNRATDRESARIRKIAEAAADRAAVWAMAEEAMPADVRDWCVRWKIAQLGEFLWCNAFVAGWRLAMSSRLPPRNDEST